MINGPRLFKSFKAPLLWTAFACLAALTLAGCGDGDDGTKASDRTQTPPAGTNFSLLSDAFAPDEPIPARFTCDGEDISPGLYWTNLPEGTQFFSLIMEDLDAPGGGFVHWVIYNIPSAGLPEGVIEGELPHTGGLQGTNDFGRVAYGGPCPPVGSEHRYSFTVHALRGLIYPRPAASKQDVLGALEGHLLGQAQLIGTYER